MTKRTWWWFTAFALLLACINPARAADTAVIEPQWGVSTGVLRTALSIQVCPEPPLRPGSPIHDELFRSLRDLHADYARLQPWGPYPRLSVAELEPPSDGRTSWNFSLIDPWVEDFFNATAGHPVMLTFGEIPEWMFKTKARTAYPDDPDTIVWDYGSGTELRDPTLGEVRDYYVRLASWYLKGGFTDEFGRRYESGHHYDVAYWEVLNEPDLTHFVSPELYTRIYDEVVLALQKLEPHLKFSALALAWPMRHPEYFQYFLNPNNHRPGVPLDMISYHFYAIPEIDESPGIQEHTFFTQVDSLISTAHYIDVTRKNLSPTTKVYMNEVGATTSDFVSDHPEQIPASYWNLSGAMFAYLYLRVAQLGLEVDAIAAAELIDYPGQYAAASLSDWNTGKPNARFRVLKLLHDSLAPGDHLVDTLHANPQVFAVQAFVSSKGERKILIVNKRNRRLDLRIRNGTGAHVDYVDQVTGSGAAASRTLQSEALSLTGFAVAVVHLK